MTLIDAFQTGLLIFAVAIGLAYLNRHQPVDGPVGNLLQTLTDMGNELSDAKIKIAKQETQITALMAEVSALKEKVRHYEDLANTNILLVVISKDAMMKADLSVLRAVGARTGLDVKRVIPATRDALLRWLDAARLNGKPIRYVHLATHAGPLGVELEDAVVDATWFSENMRGVQILVLNGCTTAAIGEMLHVVPVLVTTHENLPNRDAWQFASAFWQAVGEGLSMTEVEQRCRDRLPTAIMEYVEIRTWA